MIRKDSTKLANKKIVFDDEPEQENEPIIAPINKSLLIIFKLILN